MTLTYQCRRCAQQFAAPANVEGKKIRCPKCDQITVAQFPRIAKELRIRRTSIFEHLHNQDKIADVVCANFRLGNGDVRYRINRSLDSTAMSIAKFNLKKPFFRSRSAFIPEVALSNESIFAIFSGRIFMTTNFSVCGNNFWSGNGNYESEVDNTNITTFSEYAGFAYFSVHLSPEVYLEIEQYLELPPE